MAHIYPNMLLHRFWQMRPHSEEPQPSDKTDANDGLYNPSPIDIIVVQIMLTRSLKLAPELVDLIFDIAEYWAHSINVIDYQAEQHDHLRILGSSADRFLLRSYPLGLTGIEGQDSLSKQLAYDTKASKPLPQRKDCDPSYFINMAKYPTPRLVNPARKVVFRIKSHDQGWGGEAGNKGTYFGSWTWFEAGLERFDSELTCNSRCKLDVGQSEAESKSPALPVCGLRPVQPKIIKNASNRENSIHNDESENMYAGSADSHPTDDNDDGDDDNEYTYVHPLHRQPEWEIQRNRTATSDWVEHVITWSYLDDVKPESDAGQALDDQGRGRATGDGSFVRNLRMGDVITVWGKARFPAWVNHVDHVKIEVYWAV